MVERVVKFSQKNKISFEVIPVDDRSNDETQNILMKLAKKYSTVKPIYRKMDTQDKGNTMGKTLVAGTLRAEGEIVIWTMGDLADDTDTYSDIITKINEGFDMVFGSRYMPGGSRGTLDFVKAFLSSWGTQLARWLFNVPVHDITNAFRGFRREVFNSIKLDSAGFSISPEFAIKAHLAGYKLGEVPTVYTNRVEGVSSFKLYAMIKSYLKLYFSLFLRYKILHKTSELRKK